MLSSAWPCTYRARFIQPPCTTGGTRAPTPSTRSHKHAFDNHPPRQRQKKQRPGPSANLTADQWQKLHHQARLHNASSQSPPSRRVVFTSAWCDASLRRATSSCPSRTFNSMYATTTVGFSPCPARDLTLSSLFASTRQASRRVPHTRWNEILKCNI